MDSSHRIVIIGGGFGGLYAARALKRAPAQVTLIDRTNFHLFQPLLYQVATGGLSPANIAAPLRGLVGHQRNTSVVMAEVLDINVTERRLVLKDPELLDVCYDSLIVASGSKFNYFGHDEWATHAPGLKTLEDAVAIRRTVLSAFEKAELESDPAKQRASMTFVIVGAGPTGVELAGAVAELAHHTLKHEFRHIHSADATILLLEAQDGVLGQFPRDLQDKAARSLKRLGVTVRLNATVTEITAHSVTFKTHDQTETLAAGAVLWTAGVKASPLGAALAKATGLQTDKAGRLAVEADMTLPGHPEIFVIGDLASFSHERSQPLPGLAPVAMQQGRYVAQVIRRRLGGQRAPAPFRYFDRGNMATIGRASAVADLGWLHMSGALAWLTWLTIHLMYLAQFQNRVLVLYQWAYGYFTHGRAARLITQEPPRVDE